MEKRFEFDLYRLNIIDEDVFDFLGKPIRENADILLVLLSMTSPTYDFENYTGSSVHKWSIREFYDYVLDGDQKNRIAQIILSRSLIEQSGQTVTDQGLEDSISEVYPPLATSMGIYIWLERHLVAVEHNSALVSTDRWRKAFHKISEAAAKNEKFISTLSLEPIPEQDELIRVFKSFSRLVRLKLKILLPNPDLSRYTRKLYEELQRSAIREYDQDMKNPNGLNTEENTLPHASVSLAQAGYKRGDVTMIGVKHDKNKIEKIITGKTAARGKITVFRDQIRNMRQKASKGETQYILSELIREMEGMLPRE